MKRWTQTISDDKLARLEEKKNISQLAEKNPSLNEAADNTSILET